MSEHFQIDEEPGFVIIPASPGQVALTIDFPFQLDTDIRILRTDVDTVQTALTLDDDFILSGAGDDEGGTATLLVAALEGDVYLIWRQTGLARATGIVRNGRYDAKALDDDLDRQLLIAQDLRRDIDLAVRVPLGSTPPVLTPGDDDTLVVWQDGQLVPGPIWSEEIGIPGKSAYEIAVGNGYVGSEAAWLTSIRGASAYQVAVANGFVGDEAAWLASLEGAPGDGSGDMLKVESLSGLANYVAARSNLGLAIGTHVQAQSAYLQSIHALGDPGADRILFWDDSAGAYTPLTLSPNLAISGTELRVIEVWGIVLSDETTALTTGTAKGQLVIPYNFTVLGVAASLNTSSSSGTPTFDINEGGSSILSTRIVIEQGELTGGSAGYQGTGAAAAVISDTTIAAFASITGDIDVAGTGAKGAKLYLIGYRSA